MTEQPGIRRGFQNLLARDLSSRSGNQAAFRYALETALSQSLEEMEPEDASSAAHGVP